MRDIGFLMGILLMLGSARAQCPHMNNDLLRWSNGATWGSAGKPTEKTKVVISKKILLDTSPPSLSDITILPTGSLIFHPGKEIELRTTNIFVEGRMEIGSEKCPYTGNLTITLTGNRYDHLSETNGKGILVRSGGTLEIHGEPRLSWTKISKSLLLPKDNGDVFFEHKNSAKYEATYTGEGIVAYTVNVVRSKVNVKQFGLYDIRSQSDALAAHINNVQAGDVLMMAGQRSIPNRGAGLQSEAAYEAIEKLLKGVVSGSAVLRSVSPDGATWAFVFKKGSAQSYDEETNPLGTTSTARFEENSNLLFTVESIGASGVRSQTVNFRVTNKNAFQQMVDVIDDVTTWRPGDKVMIASTDYDWRQAEEREIVFCPECNNYQIRINEPVNFVHYGKVLHGAIDMRAEIALINRKVVIRGEMEPKCLRINGNCGEASVANRDTFGGNIKVLFGFKDVHIENIELYNMGQQTDLGSYPIHFHMCLGRNRGQSQPYVKGCSIHDTFARCITVHGTHGVLVADNTCINHMGHGYYLEDGGEKDNVIDGNLAMNTRKGTGSLEPTDASFPTGFWFTNPKNYFRNNHAAGGEGNGIWIIFPEKPLGPSRQHNLMEPGEAKRTNLLEFTNNAAHSYSNAGIFIGNELLDNRHTDAGNVWQPLVNPKDKTSDPIVADIKYMTGYKNKKFNIWVEGGSVHVSKTSVSDSLNGIMVTNEGQQTKLSGRLSYSVVIGDSENVGLPRNGFDRSTPMRRSEFIHSGITTWKGPTRFNNIWFDDFKPNNLYDIAAIAKKRGSRYFFSITTSFKDLLFAFDDAAKVGTYAISGTKADKGWGGNNDGELISGFTWYKDGKKWYVVKPDPFSAAASDCVLRPHWRLALSQKKYGNLKLFRKYFDTNSRGIFVRDDFPGAQLEFKHETNTGPQVVMDGSRTYTFHITGKIPKSLRFSAEGIEKGDILRFGICIPSGASWTLGSSYPNRMSTDDFIKVNSLRDLDSTNSDDGNKYFYDSKTRMLYYKFIGYTTRAVDETDECGGGKCPDFRVFLKGDLSGGGDCRKKLYGSRLSRLPPVLKNYTATIPASGGKVPPRSYGARATRPFKSRAPVDGGYGPWTQEWSACSASCDEGLQYKTRECNNPIPAHGGSRCFGDRIMSRTCQIQPCSQTSHSATSISTYKTLLKDLFDGYDSRVRPRLDQTSTVEVNSSFILTAIVEFDTTGQTIYIMGHFTITWFDEVLRWDPKEHEHINSISVNLKDIWFPKLEFSKTRDTKMLLGDKETESVKVLHTGLVEWVPNGIFNAMCEVAIEFYPFDIQTCDVVYHATGESKDTVLLNGPDLIHRHAFLQNTEWDVVNHSVTSIAAYNTNIIYLTFTVQRRAKFTMYTMLIPLATLAFVNVFIFLVPIDSGEKGSLAITLFLAYGFFATITRDSIPHNSIQVSYYIVYVTTLLIFSVFTVIFVIIEAKIHTSLGSKKIKILTIKRNRMETIDTQQNSKGTDKSEIDLLSDHWLTWDDVLKKLDVLMFLISSLFIGIFSIVLWNYVTKKSKVNS